MSLLPLDCRTGTHMATAGADKVVKLWDPATGANTASLRVSDPCALPLHMSHSACFVQTLSAWVVRTGQARWEAQNAWLLHHLISMSISVVLNKSLHDLSNGPQSDSCSVQPSKQRKFNRYMVKTVAMPAVCAVTYCVLHFILPLGCGKTCCLPCLQGMLDTVLEVCFTADQKHLLAAGGDQALRMWELTSGRVRHTLTGHTGKVMHWMTPT